MGCTLARIALSTLAFAVGVPQQNCAMASQASVANLVRSKIKYVFVLYQENRSYDSYFGTFPGGEGLYSHLPQQIAGFEQPLMNLDGSMGTVRPFRLGPAQYAADLDDLDHAHGAMLRKMHIVDGVPMMDQFAMTEVRKHSATALPSLQAKQFGELAMAHEDCDTIPFLWRYAKRFTLFDHFFDYRPINTRQPVDHWGANGNHAMVVASRTGSTGTRRHGRRSACPK